MQDCAILFVSISYLTVLHPADASQGDSLTQLQVVPGSFHAKMSAAYVRKLDVLNRGYGGYNTRWGRVLVDQIFARKEDTDKVPAVRLITVWFGMRKEGRELRSRYK